MSVLNDYFSANPKKENDSINQILQENKAKNFVDRIINVDKYPSINLGNDTIATHKMAWSQVGDQYIVYPSIVYNNKELIELSPDEAIKYALSNSEFIPFSNPEEASWFSQNYKKIWSNKSK
jgi:hypothetical protein